MNQLFRPLVWLSRIHHCRGFGIQSPTDYWLVRYVINEHWPYYRYASLGEDDSWLRRKLGRLYMRLANWRQPATIVAADYHDYWHAGCNKARLCADAEGKVELLHVDISEAPTVLDLTDGRRDNRSVIVVEGLWRNRAAWRQLTADRRVRISFDLYYCGLLLFDDKRSKKNYIINF